MFWVTSVWRPANGFFLDQRRRVDVRGDDQLQREDTDDDHEQQPVLAQRSRVRVARGGHRCVIFERLTSHDTSPVNWSCYEWPHDHEKDHMACKTIVRRK